MKSKIKAGSKVRLSLTCTNTIKSLGINDLMRNLFGSIQTVNNVYNGIVEIKGWEWHIEDLILLNEKAPRKKIEIQLFDPENLVV